MGEVNEFLSIYKAGMFIGKNPGVIEWYDGKDWLGKYNITIK